MPAQAARKIQVQQWWDELERLARILGQVGPDEVCCGGLTQRQCAILRTLVAQEGARISDLAASSGITPSAMTRVLEKLEARKLVERVRGTHADGRAASVKITAAGRQVRQQLDELMRERTRTIIATIPAKQRTQVLASLKLLNDVIASSGCCGLNEPVQSQLVSEIGFGKSMFENVNRQALPQPRSGVRMQPTAPAVGRKSQMS
jgi:DNA-binding MarR family transcriptional regulator